MPKKVEKIKQNSKIFNEKYIFQTTPVKLEAFEIFTKTNFSTFIFKMPLKEPVLKYGKEFFLN